MRWLRVFILIFAFILAITDVVLTVGHQQTAEPSWKIVFTQLNQNAAWQLVEIMPTGLVNTSPTVLRGDLVWSPDDEWVLFFEPDDDFHRRLILSKADGSGRRVLLEDADDVVGLTWSPDGEWILYTDQISDHHRDMFKMRRDGGERTAFGLYDFQYCCRYSQDGQWMLFYWHHDDTGSVYRTRADGSNLRHIVTMTTDLRNVFTPHYSPDGEWILFTGNDGTQHGAIYRVHPDGSGLERILAGGDNALLSVSPDGEWLAFAVHRPLTYASDLYRMKIDGTGLERLTEDVPLQPYANGNYSNEFVWSPDGRAITFFHECMLYEVWVERRTVEKVYEGCFTGRHHYLEVEGKDWRGGWGVGMGVVMMGVVIWREGSKRS